MPRFSWLAVIASGSVSVSAERAALHAYLGWETPTITDVIPDSAWTRIVRWDGHRVLAMNPTNNVIRALIQHCHASPLSILARRWDPTCGLICEGDTLTTVQLTVGSVNT